MRHAFKAAVAEQSRTAERYAAIPADAHEHASDYLAEVFDQLSQLDNDTGSNFDHEIVNTTSYYPSPDL